MTNVDRFNVGVAPTSVETYPTYRNGEVTTYSWDDGATHLCFGLDVEGSVWDFDLIPRASGKLHIVHGKLSEEQLTEAQTLTDAVQFDWKA